LKEQLLRKERGMDHLLSFSEGKGRGVWEGKEYSSSPLGGKKKPLLYEGEGERKKKKSTFILHLGREGTP